VHVVCDDSCENWAIENWAMLERLTISIPGFDAS